MLENASGINSDIYDMSFLGNTVAIELDSEEKIWERFSSKNRGHIRVAAKEGVNVRIETSKKAFDIFREIYTTTMDHDDASSYYYFDQTFFESIRCDLSGHYLLFTAYLGDVAIASSIMLFAGNNMNYHLSGQLFEYRRYAGTNMILYEAAKWGCRHGYDWLHLGDGVGSAEDSLFKFKRAFYKGDLNRFYIGKKIYSQGKYNELLSMRTDIENKKFFPEYRAN